MKKELLILLLFISTVCWSQNSLQYDNTPHYIEVTGSAEIDLAPDQIFMRISIDEKDLKGGQEMDEVELKMIKMVESLGIDVSENLSVIDMSSNFKHYFLKEKKIRQSRLYELMVENAAMAGSVINALADLGLSNIFISRVDHSELSRYRMKVKTNAIAAAKEKAHALLREIGQDAGQAIYVKEMEKLRPQFSNTRELNEVVIVNYNVPLNKDKLTYEADNIEFESIKLNYAILVRFEILAAE